MNIFQKFLRDKTRPIYFDERQMVRDDKLIYHVDGDNGHFGSELMNIGFIVTDSTYKTF